MPIILTVVKGPQAGKKFTLDRHDTFVVGRSKEAHLCLPDDPYFSRHHLMIEVNPPLCRLTDLGSRNGTLVNGSKVATAELKDGDEVAGGQSALRVTCGVTAEVVTLDLPAAGAPPTDTHTLPENRAVTIPGYRDLAEIGRGGMGVVYRGVRESDGRAVAVKTIRPAVSPSGPEVARFLREAQVLTILAHPRIVACHESGNAGGVLFFVMDFVDGTDAARLVRARGPRPAAEVAGLIEQLCDGLSFAHARGFVHRDVKPANLLLSPTASGWDLRLADFGLAKAYQGSRMSGLTVSGAAAGTPAFMPPEQVTDFKTARPAADQYAAGATAYYLMTGVFPFGGSTTAEVLKRVLAGTPDPLEKARPDIPVGVANAVHRAMAVRPADRFPDVLAFAAAMRRAAG